MKKQIILNEEQLQAKEYLLAFVNNPARKVQDYFATLAGFAGTGKTTLMKEVINALQRKKKIVVSATTHKAKEVIAEATQQNAETIQSLLGLRLSVDLTDFDPNKPIFQPHAEERMQHYDVVIIDESSMISIDVYNLIEKIALINRTKIIFMGDIYQLPPVGEIQSKVFTLPNMVSLNTIVRQSEGNPNQKLIELARNDVRDGTDLFLKYLKDIPVDINEEKEGFASLQMEEYYATLIEKYSDSAYPYEADIVKMIAWTNTTVGRNNAYIRANIIKSKEQVAVGDLLMGYSSITKEIKTFPFYIPIVKNSVDYLVEKVELLNTTFFGVTLKGYKTYSKGCKLPMFILHKDSYPLFVKEYNDRLQKGKEFRQWKSFYAFKEQIICMEDIIDDFGNLVCKKDIDYGYVITVHKSQGSTYQNVGIILKDILRNRTAKERRQLIYVAVSRTSKANYLYA